MHLKQWLSQKIWGFKPSGPLYTSPSRHSLNFCAVFSTQAPEYLYIVDNMLQNEISDS